jgi:hypothetical protein
MAAHIGVILHAAILLGLVWAARLSTLGSGWEDVAAGLVVASSALIAAKDTLNWLTGVPDEFTEKAKTRAAGRDRSIGGANWYRHLPRRRPHRPVTRIVKDD